MQQHGDKAEDQGLNPFDSWLEEHPWVRHVRSGGKEETQHSSLNNEIMESKGNCYYETYLNECIP